MSELVEDLNYDCNYNMFLTKTLLANLTSLDGPITLSKFSSVIINRISAYLSDRQKAVRWMRKLATCNKSIEEMKLRNDFMYYLVLNVQNGELRPPFDEYPPSGPLPDIAQLLVRFKTDFLSTNSIFCCICSTLVET